MSDIKSNVIERVTGSKPKSLFDIKRERNPNTTTSSTVEPTAQPEDIVNVSELPIPDVDAIREDYEKKLFRAGSLQKASEVVSQRHAIAYDTQGNVLPESQRFVGTLDAASSDGTPIEIVYTTTSELPLQAQVYVETYAAAADELPYKSHHGFSRNPQDKKLTENVFDDSHNVDSAQLQAFGNRPVLSDDGTSIVEEKRLQFNVRQLWMIELLVADKLRQARSSHLKGFVDVSELENIRTQIAAELKKRGELQ